MSRIILGIWGYSADYPGIAHDSGATLVIDGRVVAAVNEERFSRKKNDDSFPFRSIETVLKLAGVTARDVSVVALAGLPPFRRGLKVAHYVFRTFFETGQLLSNRLRYAYTEARRAGKRTVPVELKGKKLVFVGHHEAHAASAYFASPYSEATVVTLDGIGDSAICGSVSRGKGGVLTGLRELNGYYSPGIWYAYITHHYGFIPSRHEGKILGLAAYGDPDGARQGMDRVNRYRPGRFQFYSREIPRLFGRWNVRRWGTKQWHHVSFDFLEKNSREDVAAALQKMTEELVCAYVRDAVRLVGYPDVCLAGGVFANVRANQFVAEMEEVRSVYVHPGMGDTGLATGAALYVAAQEAARAGRSAEAVRFLSNVYLGPSFTAAEIEQAVEQSGFKARRLEHPERFIAEQVAAKRVVGRLAGRMEYGPRALGNRSILADPTDRSINDWLNNRLKRTEFMPFAPSILEDAAGDWYEGWSRGDVAARFMTITYDLKPGMAEKAAAVAHVDRTARPQVVRREDNPSYHRILTEYSRLTGLPLCINTSFNMHEEPIVCTPDDALRAFQEGSVDVLALEEFIIDRAEQ
jgi:carbamoyltransferase